MRSQAIWLDYACQECVVPSSSHRRTFRVRSFSAAIACTASLSLFGSSSIAQASPNGSLQPAVSKLISTITDAESELNNLDLKIGELRESVNEALLILQDSRTEASQAQRGVSTAKEELAVAQSDIATAQSELDELSRSKYRRAAGASGLREISGGDHRDDELFRKSILRTQAEEKLSTIDELDRVRTEKANKESQLRKTHELAEQRAEQAATAEEQARKLLETTTAKVAQVEQERAAVAQDRDEAQQELAAVRSGETASNSGSLSTESRQDDLAVPKHHSAPDTASHAPENNIGSETADSAVELDEQKPSGTTGNRASSSTEASQDPDAISAELRELIDQAADAVAEHLPDHTALEATPPDTPTSEQESQDPPGQIPALQRNITREETTAESITDTNAEAEGEAASALESEDSAPQNSTTVAETATDTADSVSPDGDSSNADGVSATDSTQSDVVEELSGVLEELDTNESVTEDASAGFANVAPSQQAQAVLSRARSQLGVDYAWGGGNAQGPTAGIRDGGHADSNGDFGKVGFDCSGLVQYAFAGAGISLPHYSGGQYRHGTHVSTTDLQPGDLIFYGPGGSQHVAIYSGNGMMIEAPHSGSHVREVPVRHTGMTEHAVRLLG